MDLKKLRRHWDRFARKDPMWAILTSPGTEGGKWDREAFLRSGDEHVAGLVRYLDGIGLGLPARRERALDFGCGIGRLTLPLASHFRHVDGIDISELMLRQAAELNGIPDRVTYHHNQTDDLGRFPADSFDFVYTYITLQHVEPKYAKRYIEEFVRILHPEGLAVFHVPTAVRNRRERLRQAIPEVFALVGMLRRGIPAVMEAHAIPESEVVEVVEHAGGRVEHVQRGLGNSTLPSAQYFVRKSSAARNKP
jgi:ubiquinone/menaquinone biosynthesis C-methylase UbiE